MPLTLLRSKVCPCVRPVRAKAHWRCGLLLARWVGSVVLPSLPLLQACSRSAPDGPDSTAAGPPAPGSPGAVAPDAPSASGSRASEPSGPASVVDETTLRRAFARAPAAHQLLLEEALAVSRTGYALETLEQFQKLLKHPQLTPEQRTAIEQTMGRLRARASQP